MGQAPNVIEALFPRGRVAARRVAAELQNRKNKAQRRFVSNIVRDTSAVTKWEAVGTAGVNL
jgi:hypothetical protein